MGRRPLLMRAAGCLALVPVMLPLAGEASAAKGLSATAIAVAEFDYIDTSGEIEDQKDVHAARARSFSASLRSDLTQGDAYRIVALDCREACSASAANASALLAEARRQGARLLVFGGIHKQSTLIQWLKVEVVDLRTKKVVFDRLMSFRGDDEASWHRAEGFLAKTLLNEHPAR